MSEIRADDPPHAQDNGGAKSGSLRTSGPSAADAALVALELQFNAIFTELLALEQLLDDRRKCQCSGPQAAEHPTKKTRGGENTCDEVMTRQIEMILARLDPVERAIMQTHACTITGLGVKARHAAYVISQYWENPIDQIDWDARAVRLLIEAVCSVAGTSLPFRN